MAPSRIDSMERPAGALRAPALVFVAVMILAVMALLVGLLEHGWLVALLVPIVAFTVFASLSVVKQLVRQKKRGADGEKSGKGEEENGPPGP